MKNLVMLCAAVTLAVACGRDMRPAEDLGSDVDPSVLVPVALRLHNDTDQPRAAAFYYDVKANLPDGETTQHGVIVGGGVLDGGVEAGGEGDAKIPLNALFTVHVDVWDPRDSNSPRTSAQFDVKAVKNLAACDVFYAEDGGAPALTHECTNNLVAYGSALNDCDLTDTCPTPPPTFYGYCNAGDSTCLASVPGAVAVKARVLNRWSNDYNTVDFRYVGAGGASYQDTLMSGVWINNNAQYLSDRLLPLAPGSIVSFRIRRTTDGYVSDWYTTTVPSSGYVVWRFDLTNHYVDPTCPSGTLCLTTTWEM